MLGREHSKEPLVTEEEWDWNWIYVFEECWDIEEFDECDLCGGLISKYVTQHTFCEC